MNVLQKILNVDQIRNTDGYTIQHSPITSLDLMENAAKSFVAAIQKNHDLKNKKIVLCCGAGNNGGDGLAVCRILQNHGVSVKAILIQFKELLSKDCETNLKKLKEVQLLKAGDPLPDFSEADIIIDAVLGSGIRGAVTGFVADVITAINNAQAFVYAIDVPSGLPCDSLPTSNCIVKADLVVSFQRPKRSFFFPENSVYINNWKVVDIGLNEDFIQEQDSSHFIIDHRIAALVKRRPRQSHKGTYGHALLLAGSYGKMGAAILASKACLRSGVGLVTTSVPQCGYDILQISVPEALCVIDRHVNYITTLPLLDSYHAIGIGPGIDTHHQTVQLVQALLSTSTQPLVLDADAINILSEHPELIAKIPKNTILTPHIKEFDRLVGRAKNSTERIEKLQAFTKKHHCIIVLKDAYTCISSPDGNLYYNTSGNQGMATGGSGDVLTGIIVALLAQQYTPLEAACLGVYFHGKAGDQAVKTKSYASLIASDIIECIDIKHTKLPC